MTEPTDRGPAETDASLDPDRWTRDPRPGAGTFTIEGRSAPGLFVVGWIGTILGGAIALGGTSAGSLLLVAIGLVILSVGLIAAAGAQAFDRRARGNSYSGPSPWIVLAAAIPITYLAAGVLGWILVQTGVAPSRPVASLLLVTLQVAVYLGLVRLLVVGTGALSWREMGFVGPWRRAGTDALWGAALTGPVIAATIVVAVVVVALVDRMPASPLPPTGNPGGLLLNLLTGAVLAPIGEEILFRGFATTAWARGLGRWRAVVRSGVVFALAHVIAVQASTLGDALAIALVGFATRLPIALVLGHLLLRRGSIWAPMGLHAAFNAVILIVAELAVRGGTGT